MGKITVSFFRQYHVLLVFVLTLLYLLGFQLTSEANGRYEYIYDEHGRLQLIASPDGDVQLYQYDAQGNVLSKVTKLAPGVVIPDQIDLSHASYELYVLGVPNSTEKVLFPTWTSANGQDDLVWTEGEHVSNGVWKGTIRFSEHNHEWGTYNTHIYFDHLLSFVATVEVASPALAVQAPSDTHVNTGSYSIHVQGISDQIARVVFPTWTADPGSDDLIWLPGERTGGGSWKVNIPFSIYGHASGNYITHIYAEDYDGNQVYLGETITKVHSYTALSYGSLDIVDRTTIAGWAWQPEAPDLGIDVHIYVNGLLVAVARSDIFREDLLIAGKGNGRHGFIYPMDWSGYGEGEHIVDVYAVDGSGNHPLLAGSHYVYTKMRSKGNLDVVNQTTIAGWAWQPETPNDPIDVHIYINQQLEAVVKAEIYRPDLELAGVGNGSHGFVYPIDWSEYAAGNYLIEAYAVDGSGDHPLIGWPQMYYNGAE